MECLLANWQNNNCKLSMFFNIFEDFCKEKPVKITNSNNLSTITLNPKSYIKSSTELSTQSNSNFEQK